MMHRRLPLLGLGGCLWLAVLFPVVGQDKRDKATDYVKLSFEGRGRLEVTGPIVTDRKRLQANYTLHPGAKLLAAPGGTWELFLGGKKGLPEAAQALKGKRVTVRGYLLPVPYGAGMPSALNVEGTNLPRYKYIVVVTELLSVER